MLKELGKSQNQVFKPLKKWLLRQRHLIWTSSSVASVILLLRMFGLLQGSEWVVFDLFFRLRPQESLDERIVIVGIDEEDLQTYGFPIPDADLAQLLQNINVAQPQAIGLDLYRDLPTEPGHAELTQVFKTTPNLVGIEKLGLGGSQAVKPPPILRDRQLVGFNNVLTDADDTVRRGWLYGWYEDGTILHSFALKLAMIYLEAEGIPITLSTRTKSIDLTQQVLPRFKRNDGGYVASDAGGFQYLANLRGPTGSFRVVSMSQVLAGEISPELFRDRIVLIGSAASSVKDVHNTSYSARFFKQPQSTFGVELQAHFVSQIISSALDGRPIIQVWPEPIEWLWIIGWSWAGASLCWKLRSPSRSTLLIVVIGVGLTAGAYFKFLSGWWIPVVPPLMTLMGSAVVVMAYLAHMQEEWKRSTEFLQSVINAIPDPVYVKDQYHQKIMINQAYCQLVGRPFNILISQPDEELFPLEQVRTFHEYDEMAFHTAWDKEHEGELTDASGKTHFIATKRSLHQDAAGNQFLVGVIRDITERKKREILLQIEAEQDALTGLPNRKLFNARLTQALEQADIRQHCVALFFLDLNDFKKINDSLGHHIGDLVLKTVAERLKDCLRIRNGDTVSRLGGDEFTVILPGIPGRAEAAQVAKKILKAITPTAFLNGHEISITTSIGISLYPTDTDDRERLIQKADDAMYRAKQSGKNRYEFYEPPPFPPSVENQHALFHQANTISHNMRH